MRILNLVCGIAVLLTTLHFSHGIHHFVIHNTTWSVGMWALLAAGAVVWIFSFIGGCLLVRSAR